MPAQQAEPSSATILPAPTGQSMSLRSGMSVGHARDSASSPFYAEFCKCIKAYCLKSFGAKPHDVAGSHASNPQQHRSYSAVPTPLPYNQKPRDPQAPPQGQDPWADLAGQAGQSRPAPYNRPPAGFQQQGRPQDPPQRPPGNLLQQDRSQFAPQQGALRSITARASAYKLCLHEYSPN